MNPLLKVAIRGIGIMGPGLEGWQQALPVLRGEQPYEPAALPALKPELLPPNERRRTTQLIKLAIQAAGEAQQQSGIAAAELACVFASAEGDTFIVDRLCEALTLPEKPVSPTQFHNSVHNAPAGYWAIAGKAQRFSTSIAADRASFAAARMEAAAVVAAEHAPALLVAYDVALPEPLAPFGDSHTPFAAALVLAPAVEGNASLALGAPSSDGAVSEVAAGFAALHRDNAAAEALPLLQRLALGDSGRFNLTYLDGASLPVELSC